MTSVVYMNIFLDFCLFLMLIISNENPGRDSESAGRLEGILSVLLYLIGFFTILGWRNGHEPSLTIPWRNKPF